MRKKKTRFCKGKCGEELPIRFFGFNPKGSRKTVCKKCEPLPYKLCTACGTLKILKDFGTCKDGRHYPKCKVCKNIERKEKFETKKSRRKRRKESLELPPEAKKLLLSRKEMKQALLAGRANIRERDFKL